MNLHIIHDEDLNQFKNRLALLQPQQLVLLYFTASWCGPCQRIAPFLETLTKNYPQLLIYKIDVDDCPEISVFFDISAMPTFLFFQDNKICGKLCGANQKRLEEMLHENLEIN